VSKDGFCAIYGRDVCKSESDQSLTASLLNTTNDDVIYVTSNELECPSDLRECEVFKDAFNSGNNNLKIEIIDTADLNDPIGIYGNVIIITPAASTDGGGYAVLVIGIYGSIYVDSGSVLYGSKQKKNEVQGGNIIIARINVRLSYEAGLKASAFVVIRSGSATFNNCVFSSANDDVKYVSVYIADIQNYGKLTLEKCEISNIEVKSNVLIHGYDNSQLIIEV
jgi:hypothetical protein